MLMYTDGGQFSISSQVARSSLLERYFGAVPIALQGGDVLSTPPITSRDQPSGGISSLAIETTEEKG